MAIYNCADFTKIFVAMSLLKSSVNYVATAINKKNRASKHGSKKKRQRTPLQKQLAAASAARGSRVVKRQNQRLSNEVQDLDDRNRGLQKELAANQPDLLIARATKLRESAKGHNREIQRLKYRQQQLQSNLAGKLAEKMELWFRKVQGAQKALDRVKQKYEESVAKVKEAEDELDEIPYQISFEQMELKNGKKEYDKLPATAKYNNSFDGNLAVHMQDLSLSDPVAPVAPGGVVQTGWMGDKAEKARV